MFETIRFLENSRVAWVVLNRPDLRNAFDPKMIADLTKVFTDLSRRSDLSAVVLKGEGKTFSAGADLNYMKAMSSFTLEENERDAQALDEMFWAIHSCPLPVVGRVHGHAMGGALGLTSVCDIAAAVDGTQFAFTEVKLGLAPAVISPYVLEKMAWAQARRFMLTGETFGTDEALQSGLIQFAGSEGDVDRFVATTVDTMIQNGPEAVRATKKLLRQMADADWKERRRLTTKTIAERRVSAEGQEGLRGFLEKRAPKWKPQ